MGAGRVTLIHAAFGKAEEIDDETLFAEVPSSISPRPPGRLESNAGEEGGIRSRKQEIQAGRSDFSA